MKRYKIAAYISGSGTNLLQILKNCENGFLKSSVELIISSQENAKGLNFARERNIPYLVLKRKDFLSGNEFVDFQIKAFKKHKIDLIILAGYLKKINKNIITKYKNQILNIHPALLPKFGGKGFYGMNVHKAVINNKEKISGPTIHFVDEMYDNGKIIHQRKIPVIDTDTAETLQKKVLQQEYLAYSEAIKLLEEEKVFN